MKTIGILTFHFVDNYGAILQAMALYNTIEKLDRDCSVEIINYVPPGWMYNIEWNSSSTRLRWEEKQKKLQTFLRKNCKVGTKRNSILDKENYDYYCVGSDQVWNTDMIEYFLPNLNNSVKKISYAASIGRSINNPYLSYEIIEKYVSKFDKVSVRENEHIELIEKLCNKECISVLDPTLLLQENDYKDLLPSQKLRDDEFIFFYWLPHISVFHGTTVANRLSDITKLPVVHFQLENEEQLFHRNGGCMKYEGVENFLWYIKNAKYVITNSYHGTIFSIIFKKNFWVYPVESSRSRIDTLKEKLGIGHRVIQKYISDKELLIEIDYTEVYLKLEKERERSIEYLRNALDII